MCAGIRIVSTTVVTMNMVLRFLLGNEDAVVVVTSPFSSQSQTPIFCLRSQFLWKDRSDVRKSRWCGLLSLIIVVTCISDGVVSFWYRSTGTVVPVLVVGDEKRLPGGSGTGGRQLPLTYNEGNIKAIFKIQIVCLLGANNGCRDPMISARSLPDLSRR